MVKLDTEQQSKIPSWKFTWSKVGWKFIDDGEESKDDGDCGKYLLPYGGGEDRELSTLGDCDGKALRVEDVGRVSINRGGDCVVDGRMLNNERDVLVAYHMALESWLIFDNENSLDDEISEIEGLFGDDAIHHMIRGGRDVTAGFS
uniref:Uncharacterized protein n=1 Tax=Tanacetum cinerariifolium TaxID=118510 RepID=A0A699GYI5_TANCI|nr:hypothetical protein [Tanacetum cinerariifolium]